MYQFSLPTLVLRDPDLIKQIAVKDFEHFLNHRAFIPEECDPLWGKNLFALNNEKWREMRSTLSPSFTSSKIKNMFSLISDCAAYFVKHFLKKNEDVTVVEMKDVCSRYTNDVIANIAFGIQCDSLGERNNEFYLMGRDATDLKSFWRSIKLFGFFIFPRIYKVKLIIFFV